MAPLLPSPHMRPERKPRRDPPGDAAQPPQDLSLFQANPVPLLLVDALDLRIRAANAAARRHYGYSDGELVGMDVATLVARPAELPPGWLTTRSQWELRHRDGDTSMAYVGPQVVFAGRPCHYLWAAPILPEKPAPGRAPEATAFAFAAFHDLKEPLHLAKGYLEMLRPRLANDLDGLDFLDTALASTVRMQAMVMNLLEYYRLQANATRLEPVALDAALQEALATLRLTLETRHAHVEHGDLPTVLADRAQMARLFQNLVGNAVKFNLQREPVVRVTAERDGDAWVVRVADRGIGIPPVERERIFEPFHRLHSVDEYPGSGLGLSTCRLIVEAHGGSIWAEETPGGGATVAFRLPQERA